MIRILARVIFDAVIVAVALFGAAGTTDWPRAWVLIAVLLVVRVISALAVFRVNPALLRERALVLVHQGQPLLDRILLLTFMGTAFVGVPAIAALDIFRWQLLPAPPLLVSIIGLILFVLGWIVIAQALRDNAFAVTVVRLQSERKHALVDTGIYRRIRHPMYAGNPMVLVGLSLWLGSYSAALFAALPFALLMMRIQLEERFLRRELVGYPEYMTRVPYRLIPGVW